MRTYKIKQNQIITLITDFGCQDEYVGVMKGVMLAVNPNLTFVDITHSVPPQDIKKAALILYKAFRYFPKGTIHLVVVDPGVGSKRKAIIVETKNHFFVAPDNGVLSLVVDDKFKAYRIISKELQSTTFHGRDLFAPVAAKLASGISVTVLSEPISSIVKLPLSYPKRIVDGISGEVIDIDHFGNAITNIPHSWINTNNFIVETKSCTINRISDRYEGSSPIAIWGSAELLELSLPNDSFTRKFNVKIGDKVKVRHHPKG